MFNIFISFASFSMLQWVIYNAQCRFSFPFVAPLCAPGCLTHWGRVTHICVGKVTFIGSDNGLSPGRRQAIIWTNAGMLLIGPLGTNFSEMLIEIHTFSFKEIQLKMSSGKWRPFCLGLNVLSVPLLLLIAACACTQMPPKCPCGCTQATVVGQARLEYGTILVRMYRTLKENIFLQRYLYTYTMYIPLYKRIIRHDHAWFILITMDNHKSGTYMDGRIIFFMLIHYILIKISVMDKSLSVNNQRFCLKSLAILSRITT